MGASGETTTYAQLDDRSRRFAGALRAHGLFVGDHVAILMENNARFLEVAWAAQRAGLYYTAINSHLTAGEVQHILDDSGAEGFVSSAAMADTVEQLDLSRMSFTVSALGAIDGCEPYADVLARATPLDDECEGREMLYSSGTTGHPKGVRKALPATEFGDVSSAPARIADVLRDRGLGASGSVYLSPAPLYHAAPLVTSMSVHRLGGTVVVMEQFDARQCLELIERYRVDAAQLVPTMFVRLLRLPPDERDRYDVSSLRRVVHGAAPCPVDVKRQMIEWWGPIIDEYYSGTEDIGGTYITSPEWLEHPGSVGRPDVECHVVDEDGAELPPGRDGLVYFAGGRGSEYHDAPEETASSTNDRGWRTLGDVGHLDDDGYLYLTDRAAHMIISGGVNIYPQEAENVLASHPDVLDVAVIGVPDAEMGECVLALVIAADGDGGPALGAELVAHCRSRLAGFKCPQRVEFVDDLPRDPTGKLAKHRLRERYWQGHRTRIV
jgi:fatty-acyl-CoA synthase